MGYVFISLITIAVGAVLRFAFTGNYEGSFDVPEVGLILLVIGGLGLVISIARLAIAAGRE